MVISLGPRRDRPPRRLGGCSRLPASASNLVAAESEIAAGRIALFTPCGEPPALVSVALARRTARRSGLSTPGARWARRRPGFRRAPLLCAARTFLWPQRASDHPP